MYDKSPTFLTGFCFSVGEQSHLISPLIHRRNYINLLTLASEVWYYIWNIKQTYRDTESNKLCCGPMKWNKPYSTVRQYFISINYKILSSTVQFTDHSAWQQAPHCLPLFQYPNRWGPHILHIFLQLILRFYSQYLQKPLEMVYFMLQTYITWNKRVVHWMSKFCWWN